MPKKPTIKQAIRKSLKALNLLETARSSEDEDLQVQIFAMVCKYMNENGLAPENLSDADYQAAEEDHMGYTLGAQVADCYLTEFAKVLELEPADFGTEDYYEVSETLWDKEFWPKDDGEE